VSSKDLMQELKTRVRGETPVIICCVTCLYGDAPLYCVMLRGVTDDFTPMQGLKRMKMDFS
jgi:hypothetical protein